jgi:intracellular multiplication protein IcmL
MTDPKALAPRPPQKPTDKAGMVDLVRDNLALLAERNEERKDHARAYVNIIGVLALIVVFLLYLVFVHFPQYQYLATSNTSGVCSVQPIDKAYIPEAQVKDFAESAVVSIYTYNYGTYHKDISTASNTYFSNDFGDAFMNVFSNSQELQDVIQKRFLVSAVSNPTQPPVVSRSGLRKGAWAWVVEVPVLVYYVSGRDEHEDKMLATVTVVQVPPTLSNPKGLAVDDLVTRQALN